MCYRVALSLAIVSAVLCVGAAAVWVYLMVSSEYLILFAILGMSFVAPCLLGIVLCRWRASIAPASSLSLSVLYGGWVFIMAWLGGVFFWPAAALLWLAAIIRLFESFSGRGDRVLTPEEVLTGRRQHLSPRT